jgi:hypothetical protein
MQNNTLERIYYFFVRLWEGYLCPTMICRWIKWAYQKRTRGFSDRDLWSLDFTIALFVLPRLKAFRSNKIHGFPTLVLAEIDPDYYDKHSSYTDDKLNEIDQKCMDLWLSILDKMILAFENIIKDDDDLDSSDIEFIEKNDENGRKTIEIKSDPEKDKIRKKIRDKREKEIKEGLKLLCKYFQSLWD